MLATVKKAIAQGRCIDDARGTIERAKAAGLVRGPGERKIVPLAESIKNSGTAALASVDGLKIQFVLVTPAMAADWLANNNKGNRRMRPATVAAYANDMRNGEWLLNHQGLAFNDQDELMDGQHRLSAIVESGASVTLLVSTGWPAKQPKGVKATTMGTVDRGQSRSISDILELQHGMNEARYAVYAAKIIAHMCAPGQKRIVMSTSAVLAIIEIFRDGCKFAVENRSGDHGIRQAPVYGAMAFAYGVAPEKVRDFNERLISGANLSKTNPILPLRNWLTQGAGLGGQSGSTRATATTVLEHLSLFCAGDQTDRVNQSATGRIRFAAAQAEKVKAVAGLFTNSKAEMSGAGLAKS